MRAESINRLIVRASGLSPFVLDAKRNEDAHAIERASRTALARAAVPPRGLASALLLAVLAAVALTGAESASGCATIKPSPNVPSTPHHARQRAGGKRPLPAQQPRAGDRDRSYDGDHDSPVDRGRARRRSRHTVRLVHPRPAAQPGPVCLQPTRAPAIAPIRPHWYEDVAGVESRFLEGEIVTINSYGYVELRTIRGTTSDYVRCNTIDSDGTIENPRRGGAGIQSIKNFTASHCTQSGYCAADEKPEILIKSLPLFAVMFTKTNNYRFEHMNIGFIVRCSGDVVANVVGPELFPYLSNGRYEVKASPNLDFEDGGHYGHQYGNTGDLELEGSGGTQIIQPKLYLYYLGYKHFSGRIITSQTP